jgi:hypothetical protein
MLLPEPTYFQVRFEIADFRIDAACPTEAIQSKIKLDFYLSLCTIAPVGKHGLAAWQGTRHTPIKALFAPAG